MDYTAVGIHDFYTFLLVFARVGGLIVTAPLFGSQSIPRMAKTGFVLVFSLAVAPLIAAKTGPVPDHLLLLASYVLKEALFGIALGYMARVLFSAVEMAGYLVDTQMGFGFQNLVNPFTNQQQSDLSIFQYQVAVTVYLLSNGHLLLLSSLVDSFTALPPGAVSPSAGFGLIVVPLFRQMFVLGFRLALPAVGVLVVMDVAFGLIARMVPQINVFIVGAPAKILLGMATVALLLPMIALIVGQIVAGTTAGLNALIAGAK